MYKAIAYTTKRTRKRVTLHEGTLRDCLYACRDYATNNAPTNMFSYFDGEGKFYHVQRLASDDNTNAEMVSVANRKKRLVAWIVWPKDETQWRKDLV